MPYASYCRFKGVNGDLRACIDAIRNDDVEGESEVYYAKKIKELCWEYIMEYDKSSYAE
jgi:hypothetical protein